jgi:hypothetical protein
MQLETWISPHGRPPFIQDYGALGQDEHSSAMKQASEKLPEHAEEVSENNVQVVLIAELRLRRYGHQQQRAALNVAASRKRGSPSL